jgi:transcription initiation factor TFIID subunit 7
MSFAQQQQLILRVPESLAASINQVLSSANEEMQIEVKPVEGKMNHYTFVLQNKAYPALLQNLPCLLETHKTVDMKIFYKAGDIGQILCVYSDESSLEQALSEQKRLDDIDYMPHGITPPTSNIVKKKYSKTREKHTYAVDRIQAVLESIKSFETKETVLTQNYVILPW